MFSFPILAQIMWTSLATSTCFVLFALAFSLVLKVNRVFNFAQAAMMTVGFYAAFSVVGLAKGPGWLGFIAALAGAVIVSMLLEIFGFRVLRRRRASSMFVFIFALVISELVAYLVMLVFGTWPATIFPSLFWPVTLVGPVAVSQWDVPAVAATIAAVAALFGFLHFSRSGQFMIAVADNPDLAEFYGITKDRIHLITMIVAGLLTGLAMFLYGTRAQVQPMSSIELLLFAIAATIIGGIGNLAGTAITAVVLGFVQNASVLFIPSEWQGFLLYIFLFLAIVFFPKGIRLPERRLTRTAPPPSIAADEPGEA
jgi:branched-subunit amino acid ABC-type transport system permease component